MHLKTNRLARETSPYLLQHAHNPVEWYPWGEEAFEKARAENKPLLVSIGYAACHWCHVMERESFEDEEIAGLMNKHFVNIKIDREERPDLDHIYMDAVQAMTGSGGWPLHVFLTQDARPFYGGTYFPPRAAFNRPSWKDVVLGVANTFREKPGDIESQAQTLVTHLIQANDFANIAPGSDTFLTKDALHTIYTNLMKSADKADGGFGNAPKFPQTFAIQFLLHYYYSSSDAEALKQACLSLDKMCMGGIYDQVGGGFSRYSTDNQWLVPHFEKMLYDNAQLIIVLSEAWQLTRKELYRHTLQQTIRYIQREMLSPEFGFYAALDADSEGEEGRFYVWTRREIDDLLGEESALFCEFYDVTEKGNWEGRNILHVPRSLEEFSARKNLDAADLRERLDKSAALVFDHRSSRTRPQLDDKMLLGWNALLNTALSKAYAAIGEEAYKELAINNMNFLLGRFLDATTGRFLHTYKNQVAKYPAFLDDYAYLIQALIHLQEITGDSRYLHQAKELVLEVIRDFGEEDTGLFFYTHVHQKDVVIRKKEIYDGATPSGNAIMAWNLLYLQVVFDEPEWKQRVVKMLKGLSGVILKHPTSFGIWAVTMQKLILGIDELVILGEGFSSLLKEILSIFMPHRILQASTHANDAFPLLKGKFTPGGPVIFLCKDYACQTPVTDLKSLMQLLKNPHADSLEI